MTLEEKQESREYVLQQCRQQDVKFIRLWFTDILGSLKSFAITFEELEGALTEGVGFDGGSIESFARANESDMIAIPDPSTFQMLPWRPRERRVAVNTTAVFAQVQMTVEPRVCGDVGRHVPSPAAQIADEDPPAGET